jgi:hypothetical protein
MKFIVEYRTLGHVVTVEAEQDEVSDVVNRFQSWLAPSYGSIVIERAK